MRLLKIAKFDFESFKNLDWLILHPPQYPLMLRDAESFLIDMLKAHRVVFERFVAGVNSVLYDKKKLGARELDALRAMDFHMLSYQEADLTNPNSSKIQKEDEKIRREKLFEKETKLREDKKRYSSRGKIAMAGITQSQADYLNKLFGLDTRVAKFRGLKVSIITQKKQASSLDLVKIAQRLTASEVVVNEKEADVYLVDNALSATIKKNPDFPGVKENLSEFEDLVF